MSSESSGSSVSSSSSIPQVVTTPENNILDQIAQYASSLAPQMMDWANNVFSQTSQITGEAVNNFFNASQQMTGLAGNMIGQYNDLFAPENAQLVQDANSYASPSRMATDMGMAGATQAQAGDRAIKNSEQNLLSFGIDPSAGRYASLDKAAAVQNAANVAGAENTQRMADINTGQQLRAEAVQAGSLLPGAISNAENTAIQANAGASNATLANANTGANLKSLADKYLQTAMQLKLSPVGQFSSSTGSSSNQSSSGGGSSGGGGSGGGGSGGGSSGGGSSGDGWSNPNNYTQPDNGYSDPYGGSSGWGANSGAVGINVPDNGQGNSVNYPDVPPGGDSSFAQGGAVPDDDQTTGGYVDPATSPSGGGQTDDVNAHLNAREFVVPQDVSDWKGQEFFHKLIAQSRAHRNAMIAQSPVGPKPAMQRGGPVMFNSQRMG